MDNWQPFRLWLSSTLGPDALRLQCLSWAQAILRWFEKPEETVFRQAFEVETALYLVPSRATRLTTGFVDLRVFHLLAERRTRAISSSELANVTGAEEELLLRIMRVVTALGYAREAAERQYLPSALGNALTQPALEACLVHSHEHAAAVSIILPSYLAKTDYRSPHSVIDGPFQHALHTDQTYFDFIHSNPRRMHNFNMFMTGNRNLRQHWTTWFPVRQQFLDNWRSCSSDSEKRVLLVDMGGGRGHDLQRFVRMFPESHGHLVLQDLPGTIDSLPSLDQYGITAMSHDLFRQPQPALVAGAKVFYTHFLLHDFPDEQCRVMLQHVARAMTPGYSRLLLNEAVLPERNCPGFFAAADITMMAVLSAKMRSQCQWIDLVESAGLQVLRVWTSPHRGDNEGIVEAMVPVCS